MKREAAAILLLFTAVTSRLFGQILGDNDNTRNTLVGLRGVCVSVTPIDEDAQRMGLTQIQVQTDVELKLRQAGIPVLTEGEAGSTPGVPYLYVELITLQPRAIRNVYAYNVEIELVQTIHLARNSEFGLGTTWSATGVIGTVGENNLASSVRETVRDQTDQFINAYLAANPKR